MEHVDHSFVKYILREFHVQLREQINPSETLPYIKELSTGEKQQIRRKQQNHEDGLANDELLEAVQRKPNSFIGLLASLLIKDHRELYTDIWEKIRWYFESRKRPELIKILEQRVNSVLPKSLQRFAMDNNAGRSINAGAPAANSGPERLMLMPGADKQYFGNQSQGQVLQLTSLETDSAFSGSEGSEGSRTPVEKDQLKGLQKLGPGRTPDSSLDSLGYMVVQGYQPPSQQTPVVATPDQNNYEGAELMCVCGRVLRAVGKDEGLISHWHDVLDELGIDLTMKDEMDIENARSPGYRFLQVIAERQMPGDEVIKVQHLSQALRRCGLVRANETLFGRADRRPQLHPSHSEGDNSDQLQGAVGGATGGMTTDDGRPSQHMNIEPFRSLPDMNIETQGAEKKAIDGIKNLNISPRTNNHTKNKSMQNTEYSARPDSFDDNRTNLANIPSSEVSRGNLPHMLGDSDLHSATSSYYGRQSAEENTMPLSTSRGSSAHGDSNQELRESHGIPADDQGIKNTMHNADTENRKLQEDVEQQSVVLGHSMGPSVGGDNLKEYPGRPAVDEGLKNAVHNPNTEMRKLQEDVECQSAVFGHGLSSHGYGNLHPSEQSRDSSQETENADSQHYTFDSRLQTPALGSQASQDVTSQNITDTGQQALFESQDQQNDDQNTVREATDDTFEMKNHV